MKSLLTLILVSILPIQLLARLGETEEQILKRYGKPSLRAPEYKIFDGRIIPIGERFSFFHENWNIYCVMINKVCAQIIYSKAGELTTEHRQYILRVNESENQHWVNGSSNAFMTVWLRSDGARAERSRVTSSTITLYAPDFHKKVKAIEAEDKKKTDAMPKF